MREMKLTTWTLSTALALAVLAAPCTALAVAPDHMPRVLSRDLPLIDRVLMLDDVQRPILDALLADVEAEGGSQDALRGFRDNLSAILNESQRARMPEVWAVIYKERMESAGTVSGEAVDIGALALELMRGETSEALDKRIADYRKELDPLLGARASAEGTELLRIRFAIREVNDQMRSSIAAVLPEAVASKFSAVALAKGYPSVFAASNALASLDRVLAELPTEALRSLADEARTRYAGICTRGLAAVRARDDAQLTDEAARTASAGAIAEAEREYDQFESWLVRRMVEVGTEEALAATQAGKAVLDRLKLNDMGADHAWHNPNETVRKFDKNGNGEIDGDEATAALDAFTKTVGRHARRLL